MIPLIAGGGKLVFMHKWDPELALQIIERERITGTGGVPTIARGFDFASVYSQNHCSSQNQQ